MKQLSRKKIQDMIDLNGVNISSRRSSGGSGGAGGGGVSSAWVDEHYVSKDFFARLFTINGTDENDDDVVVEPNDLDTTITNIQAMVGLWTEQYLSALGQGSGGGGGGGALLTEPLASINEAGMGTPSGANKVIAWNGSTWTYMPYTTGSGTVTSVTMTVPTGFKVSNGDSQTINNSGTFALTFGGTITKNQVLASPAAANGTPAWRALVADDIPTLTAAKISDITLTDGTLTIGNNSITPITDATLKNDYVWWGGKLDATTKKRDGNMSNVGNISFSDTGKNIGSVAYFDTTNHRLGIGSSPGAYKLDVNGDIRTSGNLYIGGTNRILSGSGDSAKNLLEFDGTQVTLAYGFRASNETRIYGQNISMYHGSTLKVQVTSTGLKIGDATLSWDSTNHALKIDTGFYSESFISALGAGSGGGGGSTTLTEPLASINEAGMGTPSGANKVIAWNGSTWTYMPYTTGGGGGGTVTAVKVGTTTYNPTNGVVTLPDYLPLTGGTLTGNLGVKGAHDLAQGNNGVSENRYYGYYIRDNNNKRSAQYINTVYPNGDNSFWMSVTYDASGTSENDKGFGLKVDKHGNCSWHVDDAPAFRTAIGINLDNLVTTNTVQTNISGAKTFTAATTFSAAIVPNGGITPIDSGAVTTVSGGSKLWLKRATAANDGTPNNGIVLEYGGSTWTGQLYMADNGRDGLYWGGWYEGSRQTWKKFAFTSDLDAYSTIVDTVTAISTSGNDLTWTKNGTTRNITVPYATNAGSATSAGNADTATKLSDTSAYAAWGKTFFTDGKPVSVSGDMTGVGSITMSGDILMSLDKYVYANIGNNNRGILGTWSTYSAVWLGYYSTVHNSYDTLIYGNNIKLYYGSSAAQGIILNSSGNVGIGTDTPAVKLDVNGTIFSRNDIGIRRSGFNLKYANNGLSSGTIYPGFRIQDAEGRNSFQFVDCVTSGGDNVGRISVYNYNTSGSAVADKGMSINVGKDGVCTISLEGTTTIGGNVITSSSNGTYVQIGGARIVWDNANTALKVVKSDGTSAANFYATGAVSALGAGSGGGSGSGITMNDVWTAMATPAPSTAQEQIEASHLSQALSGYASKTWVQNRGYLTSNEAVTLSTAQTISAAKIFGAGLKSYSICIETKIDGTADTNRSGEINRYGSDLHLQHHNQTGYTSGGITMCNNGGSVAIGYSSQDSNYKLKVNGKVRISDQIGVNADVASDAQCMLNVNGTAKSLGWNTYSDIRLKDVINPVTANVEDIANVRIFDFRWKKDGENGKIHFGSAAQDWQKIFPSAVVADKEGFLSMEYAGIAVGAVKTVAQEVVFLKKRVAELEKQLKAS